MACKLDIKKTILDNINSTFIEGRYTYYRVNEDTFRIANAQETKGKSRAKSLNQAREIALEVRNRILNKYGNNVMVEIIMPEYIGSPVELKVTPTDIYVEKLYAQVKPSKRTEYVSRLAFLQDPTLYQQELNEDEPLKMIPYEAWAVQNVAPNPVIDAKGNPVFDTALSENNLLAPQITGQGQYKLFKEEDLKTNKPGVPELFESNPELANAVYEALGFIGDLNKLKVQDMKTKVSNIADTLENTKKELLDIIKNSTIVDTHKEVMSKVVEGVFSIPGSNPLIQDDTNTYKEYNPKKFTDYINYELGDRFNEKQLRNIISNNNTNLLETIFLKHKLALLASEEGVSGLPENLAELELAKITPQQKQQVQQLYSQYLDTNPQSERGSKQDIEGFKEFVKSNEQLPIKAGVAELFDNNPELANAVYEAAGFSKNISLDDAVGKTFTIDTPIEVLPDEIQNQFRNFDIGDNFTIGYDGEKFNIYTFNKDVKINEKILSADRFKINAFDIHNNATKDVKRIREIEYIQYAFPKYQDKNINITTKEAGYIQWYLKDGFYYAELERREFYKIPAKKIQDLQAKLNIPFETEVKEKLTKVKSLEDVSSNTMKNLLYISSAQENINRFNLTPQQKQQAQQLYSQYLESLNKPNTNPILQSNQQEQVKKFAELQERLNNKEFLEGAKNAYESSKGLQEWGTQEQYNDYIARVSLGIIKNPSSGEYNYTSKVKDIVYHTGSKGLERIEERDFNEILNRKSLGKGIYFYELLDSAKKHGASKGQIYSVVLNINNPKINTHTNYKDTAQINKEQKNELIRNNYDSVIGKKEQEFPYNFSDEYVVFNPEQIHILGSKQDIEGFKEFVLTSTPTTPITEVPDVMASILYQNNNCK